MHWNFKLSVSVIIPTVGRSSLSNAIQSVERQTVECEIIVVDDSIEQSVSVKPSLNGSSVIRVLRTGGSIGGARARNLGLEASTGDYVAFLDDDDWWLPLKTEIQLRLLAGLNRPAFAVTRSYFHRSTGVSVVPKVLPQAAESLTAYILERKSLLYGDSFLQSSSLIGRRTDLQALGWDPSLPRHQDWDLMLRARAEGIPIVSVEEPLVHVYKGSGGSISAGGSAEPSLLWMRRSGTTWPARARADFIMTQIVRREFGSGQLRRGLRTLRRAGTRPHFAALLVGFSGLAKYLLLSLRGRFGRATH